MTGQKWHRATKNDNLKSLCGIKRGGNSFQWNHLRDMQAYPRNQRR